MLPGFKVTPHCVQLLQVLVERALLGLRDLGGTWGIRMYLLIQYQTVIFW